MIGRVLAAVGRRHRSILVVALVLSAAYLLTHLWVPTFGQRALPAMSAATGVFLLLGIVALVWSQPTAFLVQAGVPAFSAPPPPVLLFLTLAFLTQATGLAGTVIRDRGAEPFLPDHLVTLGYPAGAVMWVALAWRGTSVQLRPDGVWQRGITGWLVVPWEALPTVPTLPPPPRANSVRLRYGRPELVRRHGLHVYRRSLDTRAIDPRLITAAIRHYVAYPEHRAAIGTRAEYDRLMRQLLGSPAAAIAARWR